MAIQMILKKGLTTSIELNKIGLTFRPLSHEEKNNIMIKFDSLFFNQKSKKRIKDYIEYLEIKDDWSKLLPYLNKHKKAKKQVRKKQPIIFILN